MTLIVREIISGPSREELVNAFTCWWSEERPCPVFKTIDDGEWRLEIIGLQMLDGEGQELLVSASMAGTRKDLYVMWGEDMILEIKYDTKKRKGFMKQVR